MSTVPHPLLVLGLDGATFDVLDPLIAQGRLPNLARLIGEGLRTDLLSTMPPVTLPAWTSMLTGQNPGQHGVTDLLGHTNGSYGLSPVTAHWRQVPTLLRDLSDKGHHVACIGVPGTYPPEAVNGIVISGFDTPGAHRARPDAFYPPSLKVEVDRLGGYGYSCFNELSVSDDPAARALSSTQAIIDDIDKKESILTHLWHRRDWDLFFVHLQASDTAGHHLWHTFESASPRSGGLADRADTQECLSRVYARLDALAGTLLAKLPLQARVLVVSDHGMGGASDVAIHLNRFLQQHQWLSFASGARSSAEKRLGSLVKRAASIAPSSLIGAVMQKAPSQVTRTLMRAARGAAFDPANTLAFSDELDYQPSIYINRRGAFEGGVVDPETATQLCGSIREALLALTDDVTGAPLIKAVHRRQDVMHGAHLEQAPDLIIEPHWPNGFRPSFLPSSGPGPVVRRLRPEEWAAPKGSGMPGVHRREGVFVAWGPDLRAQRIPTLHIEHGADIMCRLMGVPTPKRCRQLPAWADQVMPSLGTIGDALPSTSQTTAQPGDDPRVVSRLQAMGYLD